MDIFPLLQYLILDTVISTIKKHYQNWHDKIRFDNSEACAYNFNSGAFDLLEKCTDKCNTGSQKSQFVLRHRKPNELCNKSQECSLHSGTNFSRVSAVAQYLSYREVDVSILIAFISCLNTYVMPIVGLLWSTITLNVTFRNALFGDFGKEKTLIISLLYIKSVSSENECL